jgi:hypothetical protein
MIDIAANDAVGGSNFHRRPRTWFNLQRIRRPVPTTDLRVSGATMATHFDRWANLYVRHTL